MSDTDEQPSNVKVNTSEDPLSDGKDQSVTTPEVKPDENEALGSGQGKTDDMANGTTRETNEEATNGIQRERKMSEPQLKSRVRKPSIIKLPPNEKNEAGRSRKLSEGNIHSTRQRKISFLTSVGRLHLRYS